MTTKLSLNTDLLGSARVALVHDWLTTYVGGERVLEQMIALSPAADVLTSIDVLPEHERAFLQGKRPITTFAQQWPLMRTHYRHYLPLLMLAIEQLDLSGYDVVLSSSASIGKGVLTRPISCTSPTCTRRCATRGTCSTSTCATPASRAARARFSRAG
jgi:hypothetical protein